MTDMVNKPPHYQGEIECIDYIKDRLSGEQYIGYLTGAAMKYLHRWQYKGKPEEDLAKAVWYIERLKEYIGKQSAQVVEDTISAEKMQELLKQHIFPPPLDSPPYTQYQPDYIYPYNTCSSDSPIESKDSRFEQRAKLFAERYDKLWKK